MESSAVNFRHVISFVSCQNFVVEGAMLPGRSHLNLTREPLSAMYICNTVVDTLYFFVCGGGFSYFSLLLLLWNCFHLIHSLPLHSAQVIATLTLFLTGLHLNYITNPQFKLQESLFESFCCKIVLIILWSKYALNLSWLLALNWKLNKWGQSGCNLKLFLHFSHFSSKSNIFHHLNKCFI